VNELVASVVHRCLLLLDSPRDRQVQQWAREFEHNLTAVSLFGTTEAWRAAQKLASVIYAAQGEPDQYDEKHEPEFLAAWDETIRAMRPDTAPDP
jgi:hypothetical protein